MKFSKEELQELAWEDFDSDRFEVIYQEIIDTSRWSIRYSMIFKFEDKFFSTAYSVGATESQDERPYEYEGDLIECIEVEPYEVTVTKYREVK